MPTKPEDSGSAVDEAIRALAEAPRRLTPAINRDLIRGWSSSVEALLNASFEVQNAWLATAMPLLESNYTAQKTIWAAWTAAAEQQQKTILSLWRRTSADTERWFTPAG